MSQHFFEVELRLTDFNAQRVEGMTGFSKHFGCVQQRLGRNAANIETSAAKGLALFHNSHGKAELCGLDCGDITARAGTDDNHIVRH